MMPRGFSLLEILVVVFIAGIIASFALPNLSNSDQYRLEFATEEVATALRYARDEAIRTGQVHGVEVDRTTDRIYAFKAGTGTNPFTGLTVLYHPLSKQLFDVVIPDNSSMKGVTVSNSTDPFTYYNFASQSYVLFDEWGMPFCKDSSTGNVYLLNSAGIQLATSSSTQSVTLYSGYGKVVVQ